jgi:hypothetical protein
MLPGPDAEIPTNVAVAWFDAVISVVSAGLNTRQPATFGPAGRVAAVPRLRKTTPEQLLTIVKLVLLPSTVGSGNVLGGPAGTLTVTVPADVKVLDVVGAVITPPLPASCR